MRDNYQGVVVKRGHSVDARAAVTSIRVASTPTNPGGYRVGEVIKIELAYDVPVEAGEEAGILLQLNEARDNRLKGATYSAGNGTNTLTFSYTVKAGDVDTDGLTIVGSVGDAVDQEREIFVQGRRGLALREYDDQNNIAGQSVDGLPNAIETEIISTPELGDAYGPGEVIKVEITFDAEIGIEISPILQLEIGDNVREVALGEGHDWSGTDSLLFPYTVQASDHDSDGIVILSQFANADRVDLFDPVSIASITVEAIPSGGEVQTSHKVLVPTTIQSIDILSDPGSDNHYIIGTRVEVGVTFDQAMTVTGTPSLAFETDDRYGDTEVRMEYDRTAGEGDQEGAIVVFAYTLVEGDSAGDGIYIPGNAFRLDEGDSLTGPEGNPANLDHEIFNHPDSHFIDATRPTFRSAQTSALGEEVRVKFSENVGAPPLLSQISQLTGLDLGVFYAAVLDVTVDGNPVIPDAASISGDTITLGMPDESQIQTGQVVKVSYDNIFALDAPGLFVDSKGNALNSFGPKSVENSSDYNPAGGNRGLNAPRLVLSKTQIRVPEESSVTYTVAMTERVVPEGFKLTDATVNITSLLTNDNLTVTNSTLTFTRETWTTPQTVTLTAAADDDSFNYWATLAHTVTGGWLVVVPGNETLQIVTPVPAAFHVRVVVDDDD